MKIGIIVHSMTGNTFAAAEKLKECLAAKGHSVEIARIQLAGEENPRDAQFKIEVAPEVAAYDAVLFGAPVRGFSISPVMAAYLNQLPTLQGKKAVCFVTKGLAGAWTGGKRAIEQMQSLCEAKGGQVCGTGMIVWSARNREQSLSDMAQQFSQAF